MKRSLFYLLVFALAIVVGVYIAHDPGYSLFAYGHWTVEMPLWLSFFLLIMVLLCVHFFTNLSHSAEQLNKRYANWQHKKQQQKQEALLQQSILNNLTGNYSEALKQLNSKKYNSSLLLIYYLQAATAANGQQLMTQCDGYLQKAATLAAHHQPAINMFYAELLCNNANYHDAAQLLEHVLTIAPKQALARQRLMKIYIQLQAFDKLNPILPNFKKDWHETYIAYYGLGVTDEPELNRRLKTAESWLKRHPDSANLYLCLGYLCQALAQWDKGKNYLLRSIELKPQAMAYKALAECYEQLQLPQEATKYYKKMADCIPSPQTGEG